jgi:hypothetical protein
VAGGTIEIERERSAPELVSATFSVYQRFPLLFLILAAGVVVPYELIVLAVTGAGPLSLREVSGTTSLILSVIDMFLIGPLISALHVHAVQEIRDGTRPQLASVASKAVTVLPVVIAAVIISWLGIIVGFVALIVPGIRSHVRPGEGLRPPFDDGRLLRCGNRVADHRPLFHRARHRPPLLRADGA